MAGKTTIPLFVCALLASQSPGSFAFANLYRQGLSRAKQQQAAAAAASTKTQLNALAQFGPDAAKLFGSMIVPSTVLAGSMIPLGFAAPVENDPDSVMEHKATIFVRRLYPFLSLLTFSSQLLTVVWATVAVNQLTETKVRMTESVWHLLSTDYALEWSAVNAHFVVGVLGFMGVLASKVYFLAGKGAMGASVAGFAGSVAMLITAIVNRGVAEGGGGGDMTVRFGGNVLALFSRYLSLFFQRALSKATFGPLEVLGSITVIISTIFMIKSIFDSLKK